MIIFGEESRNRPSIHNIGKVTFSLHTLWKHRKGLELQTHQFLTSALEGSEWPASDPGPFTLWDRIPTYPLNRRLGETRGLSWSFGWRGNSLSPAGICIPDHLVRSLVTIPTTLSWLHKYKIHSRKCQDFYLLISLPGQSLILTAILAYGYHFKSAWETVKKYKKFTPKEIILSSLYLKPTHALL
jgi:hypothetical protein